jgi:prepilin-type N-terminal cleavage/methylation domain-containing protein
MYKVRGNSAFSLVELSIVILVIGILIVGVISGGNMITKYRILNARTLTQTSQIASITGLYAWYETSSENSFDSAVVDNNDSVTTWHDMNPQNTTKLDITQGSGSFKPTYKLKSLNDIPTVYFDGGDVLSSTLNFGMTGNPDFTFVVVAKVEGGSWGSFISAGTNSTCQLVAFDRYSGSNNGVIFTGFRNGGQYYTHANLGSSSIFAIHVWVREANNTNNNQTGNTAFVNGQSQALSNQGSTCTPNIGVSSLSVGSDTPGGYFLSGNIAEIIIFNQALETRYRESIEQYLSQKWGIALN